MLCYVKRSFKGSSRNSKEKGYSSHVRQILDYATTIWDLNKCCQPEKIRKGWEAFKKSIKIP